MKDDTTFNLIGAANHLGVKPSTVRYWAITGRLRAALVNGHWVIRRSDLERADKEARSRPRAGKRGKRGKYVPFAET